MGFGAVRAGGPLETAREERRLVCGESSTRDDQGGETRARGVTVIALGIGGRPLAKGANLGGCACLGPRGGAQALPI